MEDKYRKLKPWPATSPDERCSCSKVEHIYLAHKLVPNPFYCLICNGEIAPESLPLNETIIDAVASWNSVFGSLYALWLDSGEYEQWAEQQLLNPTGQVNEVGLSICHNMSNSIDVYYLWFYPSQENRPVNCPRCSVALCPTAWSKHLACHECRIIA